MSWGTILAPVPNPGTPTKILGPGDVEDLLGLSATEAQIRAWQRDGKVALVVPDARSISVSAIGTTTATIGWIVDQACQNMRVQYGTTTAMSTAQNATPLTGVGAVVANLTGLTTGTLYYYSIVLFSTPGGFYWTTSPTYTFTTN